MKDETQSAPTNWIHIDLERTEYALTAAELQSLQHSCDNNWKDFCIGCLALGVPCVVNAVSRAFNTIPFTPTLEFVINLVLGSVGIVLGIAFLVAWQKSKKSVKVIVDGIKAKPRIPFVPGLSPVGALPGGDQGGNPVIAPENPKSQ